MSGPILASLTSKEVAMPKAAEKEPDIYNAIRFGSTLKNVVYEVQRQPSQAFAAGSWLVLVECNLAELSETSDVVYIFHCRLGPYLLDFLENDLYKHNDHGWECSRISTAR